MFLKFIVSALVLVSATAFAQRSEQLGRPVYLYDCGGSITLNEAPNGDLSIQLHNVNTYRCPNLQVSDASSGRVIKSYYIQGTSYTLSRAMLASLNSDCRVNFNIGGSYWSNDGFLVYIPWCFPRGGQYPDPSYPRPPRYPQPSYPPYPAPYPAPRDRITYEWSNKHNCKKMINGQYSGQNVPDYFCR